MEDRRKNYVILGNGMAGISAAENIRIHDSKCRIVMISDEDVLSYSRPMLSKTPLLSYDLKKNFLYPESWYKDNNIEVVLDAKIEKLDVENKEVITGKGIYQYDKCIYALGASNFMPPIPGSDMKQVVSVRTYKDIEEIKKLILGATSAVLIGGGVIGLEMALELSHLGITVTVVETLPYLMPRLLDEETAKSLEELLNPIKVITGANVAGITPGEKAADVSLADGTIIPADFVIMSCGVRANTSIAKEAGIECDRAVVVNDHMETSVNGVYACGDCAEYNGMNYALWSQAKVQGQVAGANACGKRLRYGMIDSSLLLNTPEFAIFAVGDAGKNPDLQYEVETVGNNDAPTFAINPHFTKSKEKRWYCNGELKGAIRVGSLVGIDALRKQIFNEEEVHDA
ncbi:NAD(P)/FAD-dependent oxidoreductase [Clostridium chromiireducens]|uniref:NAD(P)/FAD-dependent oxidoreductase n=1 Tax=Clostridium chromiireducens TaxID=225345 RepID=UPI003AF7C915